MNALLFDIGGTNIRLALARHARLSKSLILPVPRNFLQLTDFIRAAVQTLQSDAKIKRIIGGVPGVLDVKHRTLIRSPNLSTYVGKPIASDLEKAFSAPVRLENDSDLVGLGEATHGAGKGFHVVGYLGLGTGVGGTRVIHGQLDKTAWGLEPGHQIIDMQSKFRCKCGKYGDLESLVSGSGIEKIYHQSAPEITDKQAWRKIARHLAIGVLNIGQLWSPDVIVLGGSVMKKLAPYLPYIRKEAALQSGRFRASRVPGSPRPIIIKRAQLGDFGGLYGALELCKQTRT